MQYQKNHDDTRHSENTYQKGVEHIDGSGYDMKEIEREQYGDTKEWIQYQPYLRPHTHFEYERSAKNKYQSRQKAYSGLKFGHTILYAAACPI